MTKLLQIRFAGTDLLTGLPEYRNGGLFIDTGFLTLKEKDRQRGIEAYMRNAMVKGQPNMEVVPLFTTDDDVIVEWRAVTVGLLDDLLPEVNRQLGLQGPDKLNLAQMLEAGSWKVRLHRNWSCEILADCHLGWKRISGGVEAEYQRASNHDRFRRDSVLMLNTGTLRHIFILTINIRVYRLMSMIPNGRQHKGWDIYQEQNQ